MLTAAGADLRATNVHGAIVLIQALDLRSRPC
jgi:hypothetical protein